MRTPVLLLVSVASAGLSVALLFMLALGLRVTWAWSRGNSDAAIDPLPDQREYLSLAQNLLEHRQFRFFDPRFGREVRA